MIAAFVTRFRGYVAAPESADAYYVEQSTPNAPRCAVVQGFTGVGLATETSDVRLYNDDVSESDLLRLDLRHGTLGAILVTSVVSVAEMVHLQCVSDDQRRSTKSDTHNALVSGVSTLSLLAADADEVIILLLSGQST